MPPQLTLGTAYFTFGDLDAGALRLEKLWSEQGFQTPLCWSLNLIVSVLRNDVASAREWVHRGPIDDTQKHLLFRFVDTSLTGRADAELIKEMRDFYWRRADYPLGVWLLGRLQAYEELFALLNDRLDRGLLLETRSLWAPGTGLREQPQFLDLLERIGLIDYWNTSIWGAICLQHEETIDCSGRELSPELLQRVLQSAEIEQ